MLLHWEHHSCYFLPWLVGYFADLGLGNGLKIFSHEGTEVLPMRMRFEDSK